MEEDKEQEGYQTEYSEKAFWDKVSHYAKAAGREVLETALKLYYSARDEDTPAWAKTTIIGALGYFILPLDAIPDIIAITGYTDDLSVLGLAVASVARHIKPEHKEKAKEMVSKWLDKPTELEEQQGAD